MPKNTLKYAILLVLLGVVAYNSVYFKKLDEVNATSGANAGSKFDAAAYANTFWTTKLLPAGASSATELSTLISSLKTDREKAFDTYSHALGIGNIRYFLVKGEGQITAIGDNDVTVALPDGESVNLATEYIFGNAARDASGLIKITEFDNTMDLNNVSTELNTIIRNKVIPLFKASTKTGSTVKFVGVIELNKAHLRLENLEVILISVELGAGSKGQGEKSLTSRIQSKHYAPGTRPYILC
ncbi:DUF2291 domain-containing protein [Spirosoma endophyticum]|uniref:Predicted lipoprotein n=1 Tax=Spirosoma endophyticum TaxID=662367 RepID=A0A1I1QPP2_9BACT|nr:DUF2291 domain-containing protein [Spirosoma endophyticum]SFD24071.1 Predicted lipoprotein [Spirosoma endophyticum]